ncbi:hypothetical protein ECK4_630 [Escherichia coli O5:K4(L):H4 str. ATCC 23502]|nr:hypothetical protein ECK4_630 [Escherichia coli O5:K4(L):H4 str. ATCC 23502]
MEVMIMDAYIIAGLIGVSVFLAGSIIVALINVYIKYLVG